MRIEEIAAAEPMTEENEQELMRLARRYVAVARLLRQREELQTENEAHDGPDVPAVPPVAETGRRFVAVDPAELERLRKIEQRAIEAERGWAELPDDEESAWIWAASYIRTGVRP